MRSPAAAIAWEFRRQHRWGWAALTLYLTVLAAIRLTVLGPGGRVTFDEDWQFVLAIIVPLASTFMYFMAVFSFGLEGDLATRESIYPARMFTRPVTSAGLAGWPMLYGMMAMAMLWLATRLLAVWPAEAYVPGVWPALFAAVNLAWTQALTWMPYPLRGLRVVITVLWLSAIGFAVLLALHFQAPEGIMLALLAPHLPLAYLVACFAVARARRGEVPDWRRSAARTGRISKFRWSKGEKHWPSPERAQLWFEWRRHGRSLPAVVGLLLPFELSLLFVFQDTPTLVAAALVAVLLTPPFLATFVAAIVRSSPGKTDTHGLTPFVALRPLTSVSLITAKLKATILSALASWLLVLVAISLVLWSSGTSSVVVDMANQLIEIFGTPRTVGLALLGLAVLVVSTWKQLVQSLYIGMSGRPWLVRGSVFGTLSVLTLIVPFVPWILKRRDLIATLWNALPWILAVLVCCKISAAIWIAIRLHDGRVFSGRTLMLGALCWDFAVLAFYGLLVWIVPTLLIHNHLLAFIAILSIPLTRLSAAPLALAWNRHR